MSRGPRRRPDPDRDLEPSPERDARAAGWCSTREPGPGSMTGPRPRDRYGQHGRWGLPSVRPPAPDGAAGSAIGRQRYRRAASLRRSTTSSTVMRSMLPGRNSSVGSVSPGRVKRSTTSSQNSSR